MEARKYYNQKQIYRRSLEEGDGIRNTHNFIKAILINMYIKEGAHILDLGCGQGGDILKYKRRNPKSYRGVDISHTAIEAASTRMLKSGVKFRVTFECFDFCVHEWGIPQNGVLCDVVSCQFALQYAFSSEDAVHHTLSRIASVLRPNGLFIGTIPVHSMTDSYHKVVVQLPDDSRKCIEWSAQKQDVETMCGKYKLTLLVWTDFDVFYDNACKDYPDIRKAMRAFSRPDPKNAVFVFMRLPDLTTQEGLLVPPS